MDRPFSLQRFPDNPSLISALKSRQFLSFAGHTINQDLVRQKEARKTRCHHRGYLYNYENREMFCKKGFLYFTVVKYNQEVILNRVDDNH